MVNLSLLLSERCEFKVVDDYWLIEHLSIECREPKTKVINNQSED